MKQLNAFMDGFYQIVGSTVMWAGVGLGILYYTGHIVVTAVSNQAFMVVIR